MKKTRFVKMSVEFVLAFDEDLEHLPKPLLGATEPGRITSFVCAGLHKLAPEKAWDGAWLVPGTRFHVRLTPATKKLVALQEGRAKTVQTTGLRKKGRALVSEPTRRKRKRRLLYNTAR